VPLPSTLSHFCPLAVQVLFFGDCWRISRPRLLLAQLTALMGRRALKLLIVTALEETRQRLRMTKPFYSTALLRLVEAWDPLVMHSMAPTPMMAWSIQLESPFSILFEFYLVAVLLVDI
jgi:hypothetical protein